MKNLFLENLDVVDHITNEDLDKVATIVNDLRDNAKKAYIPSYQEQQERADKDVALVMYHPKYGEIKKFACFNQDLTELNLAFLADKLDSLPEDLVKVAACNLTAAANKFGVPVPEELKKYASKKFCARKLDVTHVTSKHASKDKAIEKTANAKTVFALANKYPLDITSNIIKSAEWFDRNYVKLSLDEQREFIENVARESNTLGVSFEKTASAMADFITLDETSFNPEFFNHIAVRKGLLKDDSDDMKINYNELVKRADAIGPVKAAYVLEALDKEAGLDYYYGKNIVDPLRATLGIRKIAGVEIDGVCVTNERLRALDQTKLASIVGNGLVSELCSEEGITILASLPSPLRKEILELL